jgi:type VI secretion system secreted protein Hcp
MDAFVKIKNIPGESSEANHKEWIEVLSYSFGVSNSSSPHSAVGGGTTERANFQDISLTKFLDKASPKLLGASASGLHLEEVLIEFMKGVGEKSEKALEIKLEDVIISSYQLGGSRGDGLPTDSFSLSYGKIKQTYYLLDNKTGASKGVGAQFGWNLQENKPMGA